MTQTVKFLRVPTSTYSKKWSKCGGTSGKVPMIKKSKIKPAPKMPAELGEIRKDITRDDWVVIAKGRARRPDNFAKERPKPRKLAKFKKDCPFCEPEKFPQF